MKTRNQPFLKKLDFYIGIPLLRLLGFFRKKKTYSEYIHPSRVAVVKTAGLGDAVLSTAIIQEIKATYPSCEITFIAANATKAILPVIEDIDQAIVFDMTHPFKSFQRLRRLTAFDYVLDLGPWPRIDALITYAISARVRVGFKRKDMYRHYIYDIVVEHRDELHEIDNYRNILRAVGFPVKGVRPQLNTLPCKILEKEVIVFHPFPAGSIVALRSWPMRNWCELGAKLASKGEYIVISGGKDDQREAEYLEEEMRNRGVMAKSVAGAYNLLQMATVLAQAKCVVSVNTGIMHMAAAVEAPLVALHGASSVQRWGPISVSSEKTISLAAEETCQPCVSLGFESKCQNPVCMEHLYVEDVFSAVLQVMHDVRKPL